MTEDHGHRAGEEVGWIQNGGWKRLVGGALVGSLPLLVWNLYMLSRSAAKESEREVRADVVELMRWKEQVAQRNKDVEPMMEEHRWMLGQVKNNQLRIEDILRRLASIEDEIREFRRAAHSKMGENKKVPGLLSGSATP